MFSRIIRVMPTLTVFNMLDCRKWEIISRLSEESPAEKLITSINYISERPSKSDEQLQHRLYFIHQRLNSSTKQKVHEGSRGLYLASKTRWKRIVMITALEKHKMINYLIWTPINCWRNHMTRKHSKKCKDYEKYNPRVLYTREVQYSSNTGLVLAQ